GTYRHTGWRCCPSVWLFYGLHTLGSRDRNFTIGLGYGFTDEGLSNYPIVLLDGMARLSRRFYLLSENYFINIDDVIFATVSLGGRLDFRRVGLDMGLYYTLLVEDGDVEGSTTIFPWLGVTVPFGR
ncbi:MAG: hypothetical protein HC880_11295, partial [Bacteroidia bacterium]|nr:hypothetical protein [Bacteroidia bacterium]